MPKYRKKPVVINAVQLTKKGEIPHSVSPFDEKWLADKRAKGLLDRDVSKEGAPFFVSTLEGQMFGSPNDYLIQGVHGEIYFCKPDIFGETYDKEEEV